MQKAHKDLLRSLVMELRHTLDSAWDDAGAPIRGDLDRELERIGIGTDGSITPLDALRNPPADVVRAHGTAEVQLAAAPKAERPIVRAAIVERAAYTWINRLLALRALEARGLIEETLRINPAYEGISEALYVLRYDQPQATTGADGGWWAVLEKACRTQSQLLSGLFDWDDPNVALRPSTTALLRCVQAVGRPELDPVFADPDAISWSYQFYQEEAKKRVYAKLGSGGKVESRSEIAAATQFFTEPYMVQWLLENSLGRSYHEAYPDSALPAGWAYYIDREKIDKVTGGEGDKATVTPSLGHPFTLSELTFLDPCTGSGHFQREAFDMLFAMYREQHPQMEARAIADRVLSHHLHGIDIDPRAVQIAGLSLWLRAQRSWQEQGMRAGERPVIRKSNIVCAEPMPGDKALLEEFLAELREERLESLIRQVIAVPENQRVRATPSMADALAELVRTVWAEMELAGEAGSLLKIEGSLAEAIERGRAEWDEKLPLFRVETFRMTDAGEGERPAISYPRTMPDGDDFWARAEGLVLAALEAYAQRAENGRSYARRLFAGDAAQGFAFIDLCRKRYDVVLMNPPFGDASKASESYLMRAYPGLQHEIYGCFIDVATTRRWQGGTVGAITSRTWMFLPRRIGIRRDIIANRSQVSCLADLGHGVLDDALVETCAFIMQNLAKSTPPSIFVRLVNVDALMKADTLLEALLDREHNLRFELCQETFDALPGMPFAYWISSGLLNILSKGRRFGDEWEIGPGLTTRDNERFVRGSSEVPRDQIRKQWIWFAKGGDYSPYYFDTELLLNYSNEGAELKAWIVSFGEAETRFIANQRFYLQPGLTYPRVTNKGFNVRVLREGHIFAEKGISIFPLQSRLDRLAALAYLNSGLAQELLSLMAPSRSWEKSFVANLPPVPEDTEVLASGAAEIVRLIISTITRDVTSNLFSGMPIGKSIFNSFEILSTFQEAEQIQIADLSRKTSLRIRDVFSLSAEEDDHYRGNPGESVFSIGQLNAFVSSFLDYIFGLVLGRWDIRYATGAKTPPELPDPFAPLPVCPPGMLQNAAGLPAAPSDVPSDYPLAISWPGILVDDAGHPEDIEGRVREALAVIWPENADAIEQEACQILGVESLRAWFAVPNRFFDDHLKRYSKSRRAAPIYWPLSSASGSYTLWLYYHRLTDQTLYLCVNDFVEPKLKVVGDQLAVIRGKGSRSGQEERELERLDSLERELLEFREELLRVARFWRPNLNDGAQISAAPLRRLFRHRGWSRRLQETWEKLEAGEYDWAHLAMSIWPARVVPKCVADRSLAIAHDVEDLFWVEDGGAWRKLRSPEEEMAEQRRRLSLSKPRGRAVALLGDLARRRGQAYSGAQVYAHLAAGDWDDLPLARLLWPQRAAEKCWNDPLLAMDWRVTLPGKSTKKAQREFFARMEAEGCPEVAPLLAAALAEEHTPFPQLWTRLSAGERDDTRLALSLWPERVLDKCLADANLAGVHGLRGFFWVQGAGGVWRRRVGVGEEVKGEVARRG